MTPARFRLVILDFDGTLSDSGHWFLSIVDDLADRFNFRHVTDAEVETLRGRTTREVIAHLGIARWKLPFIARHLRARFARNTDQIRLFDGVGTMLQRIAAAGVRIVICSSNAENNVRAILGAENAALVERYVCGSGLFGKARKFRRIVRWSGIEPAAILAVGDETRDVDAAREVGLSAGVVLWGYAHREALMAMRPDVAFEAPGEIADLLAGQP